jgi:hypothetical protein
LDIPHYFRNTLLLLQDAGGKLLWRQMGHILTLVGIFSVEVAAVGQQVGGWHSPGSFSFFALFPPRNDERKLFKLDGRGLCLIQDGIM